MAKIQQTLMSEKWFTEWPLAPEHAVIDNSNNKAFQKRERELFLHGVSNECSFVEPPLRQLVFGPLKFRVNGTLMDVKVGSWTGMPSLDCVEELTFSKCTAKQILLVWSNPDTLMHFYDPDITLRMNTVCVLCENTQLPHVAGRRFIRRLQDQYRLPVYVLTDCCPMGYFVYSVMKRGTVTPGLRCEHLASVNPKYLGVRAMAQSKVDDGQPLLEENDECWQAQMKALSKYECFQTGPWRSEFSKFSHQRGTLSIDAALHYLWGGRSSLNDLFLKTVQKKQPAL